MCVKFIPTLVTKKQKKLRFEVPRNNFEIISNDLLKRIITGDEKARQRRSNVQLMLMFLFDYEGILHHEYAPRDQTSTKEYNVEVLKRIHDAVRRKPPRFWSKGDWLLHHDNLPAHLSNLVHTRTLNEKLHDQNNSAQLMESATEVGEKQQHNKHNRLSYKIKALFE